MNKMQEYFHKKETELRIDLASNREDWNFQDAFKNEIRLELLKEVSDQYGRLHNGAAQSEQLVCDCSQGKGVDIDEDGFHYCIDCQKNIAK